MSRVGRKPVEVPSGVQVDIKPDLVTVKGPNATLEQDYRPEVTIRMEDNSVVVERNLENRQGKAYQGLYRQLISNMIEGVTKGFRKGLEIVGVGYRAQMQGNKLVLQIGFAHPVEVDVPEGLKVEVPKPTIIVVTGADKQRVGQFAAQIRAIREPEPYKGKGIRYEGEYVRRLQGKSFGGK
jgi:large subunit ribosomal protein L6